MVKFLAPLAFAALIGSTLASPVAAVVSLAPTATAITPNPSQVYINSISYGGTGCPQGSVGSFLSADRQTCVVTASLPDIAETLKLSQIYSDFRLLLRINWPRSPHN